MINAEQTKTYYKKNSLYPNQYQCMNNENVTTSQK